MWVDNIVNVTRANPGLVDGVFCDRSGSISDVATKDLACYEFAPGFLAAWDRGHWTSVADTMAALRPLTPTAIVIGNDAERQRLSLSIKQTEPDPWWDVGERYAAGKTCGATVVRLESFGAFAELEKGLEGLIHVSNMGDFRVSHPRDVVKVGDRVSVEVMEASEEARRIGLKLLDAEDS